MRKLAPFAAITIALACGACSGSEDKEEFTPVVMVHGCPPPIDTIPEDDYNALAAGMWTGDTQGMPDSGMADYFVDQGYSEDDINVIVFSGDNCPPNDDFAAEIEDFVADVLEDTGKERVDIIAMSMGALASRVYLNNGGHEFVEDFVAIVGANHGSSLAKMVGDAGQEQYGGDNWVGALEAAPKYACEGESTAADVQFRINGCLTADGRTVEVDETPFDINEGGHIRYLSVWNDQDDLVVPPQASCLNQAFQEDCSDPVNLKVSMPGMTDVVAGSGILSAHSEPMYDPDVFEAVYEFVTAPRD
jgi:pimeloyl-ACP methyl ester carboxylesterase